VAAACRQIGFSVCIGSLASPSEYPCTSVPPWVHVQDLAAVANRLPAPVCVPLWRDREWWLSVRSRSASSALVLSGAGRHTVLGPHPPDFREHKRIQFARLALQFLIVNSPSENVFWTPLPALMGLEVVIQLFKNIAAGVLRRECATEYRHRGLL